MSFPLDQCPACGGVNHCASAEGASKCWCAEITISPGRSDSAPGDTAAVACLCADCASGVTPSPCSDICEFDFRTQTCQSCLRTMQEIQDWSRYGARERSEVFQRIQARRR